MQACFEKKQLYLSPRFMVSFFQKKASEHPYMYGIDLLAALVGFVPQSAKRVFRTGETFLR